jgi:predicted GNAT family acetyltransferase
MDRPGLFQGGFPILGYESGEAVSCAYTEPIDGRLYVAFVATVPGHRRKGYAEACMRRSLEAAAAATGIHRTFLHASDAGMPIYARMGYQRVTSYTLFGQGH